MNKFYRGDCSHKPGKIVRCEDRRPEASVRRCAGGLRAAGDGGSVQCGESRTDTSHGPRTVGNGHPCVPRRGLETAYQAGLVRGHRRAGPRMACGSARQDGYAAHDGDSDTGPSAAGTAGRRHRFLDRGAHNGQSVRRPGDGRRTRVAHARAAGPDHGPRQESGESRPRALDRRAAASVCFGSETSRGHPPGFQRVWGDFLPQPSRVEHPD